VKKWILYIQDIDLLEHPRNEGVSEGYPAFRTSFWTFNVAGAHSIHFLNFPDAWSTTGTEDSPMQGAFSSWPPSNDSHPDRIGNRSYLFLKGVFRRDPAIDRINQPRFVCVHIIGYLLLLQFTYMYRDFFIYEGYLCLSSFVNFSIPIPPCRGTPVCASIKRIRWSTYILDASMIALLIFYILDSGTMIAQIYLNRYPF